jgi:predicted RNase H-like nuclease (RuvC/YqgF family)
MNETLARAKAHETRIRELEEELQANDRIEALEKSLKGTQDRAESLEFQLSKSKQVFTCLAHSGGTPGRC